LLGSSLKPDEAAAAVGARLHGEVADLVEKRRSARVWISSPQSVSWSFVPSTRKIVLAVDVEAELRHVGEAFAESFGRSPSHAVYVRAPAG
jgi:hypothetical protein